VDFTREPIIQTVITPKEGCKLVVRSSKSSGQEEYFVDAVEVVSFGSAIFFRSQERPKSFIVPVNDYEVLEVREARMVLKNVGLDRSIKIGGGREGAMKGGRDSAVEKVDVAPSVAEEQVQEAEEQTPTDANALRIDKKRDRRRQSRRRRGRDEGVKEGDETEATAKNGDADGTSGMQDEEGSSTDLVSASSILTSLLPPPPTLISETIARYRDNDLFKGAFFLKEEEKTECSSTSSEEDKAEPTSICEAFELAAPLPEELPELIKPTVSLTPPEYGSFEMSEEEAEEIYRHRQAMLGQLHTQVEKGAEEVEHTPIPEEEQSVLTDANPEEEQLVLPLVNPEEEQVNEEHSSKDGEEHTDNKNTPLTPHE
jgi:hypothetical protein